MQAPRCSIVCLLIGAAASWGGVTAHANPKPAKNDSNQAVKAPPIVLIPGARVSETGLLVGGQPTTQHLEAIQQAGYRTVISVRGPDERGAKGEQAVVERLGMTFVSIPVRGEADLTEENARALGKAIDKPGALPAVVHCRTGQRASALLGLEAFVVDRASVEAAIALAKSLGMTKFEAALRKRAAQICKDYKSRKCEPDR